MKIILDAHGGDNAPFEILQGAVNAINEDNSVNIILVGKEDILRPMLDKMYKGNNISIVNATEVISNDEIPTKAVREKRDSSMVVGLNLLKNSEDIAGMVSAGSTGALLTGALMICKRIKGISRPALVPLPPTVQGGRFALSDCGANADCKAINLQHFALMGSLYMKALFKMENPRVALLNNGTEEGKGNELSKEAYGLIKSMKNINFIGNIEARETLMGLADVIVCDGFTGNIALKSNEGMAKAIFYMLKEGIKENGLRGKIGALCLKPVLKNIKKKMDANEQAGGTFLGVEKIVVKAHGSSTRVSIRNCIFQVKTLAENNLIESIKIGIKEIGLESDEENN